MILCIFSFIVTIIRPTLAQLGSCVDIRKVRTYPDNPGLPFCGCEDDLFARKYPDQKPIDKLPPKPDPRAPTSDNLLLKQTANGSPFWAEEGEGWARTKETPSIQDLQDPRPKSIRDPLFPEEGEGWATTRDPLWPRRKETAVGPNSLQDSRTESTPLWTEEGQGWATTGEDLPLSPNGSRVKFTNDGGYASSHRPSHAGDSNNQNYRA
jgi:hypothetical protein